MTKTTAYPICILAALTFLAATPTLAQETKYQKKKNQPTAEEARRAPSAKLLPEIEKKVVFKTTVICSLNGPAEVQGYRVQCSAASFIDFSVADCCIPGDHWSLKGKNWDAKPNTAVTTSPGPSNQFGVFARTYNYGGTPERPRNMDTYIQCSYLHGVDVFPAGSYVNIVSDGQCTVTPDTIRSRIDRAP